MKTKQEIKEATVETGCNYKEIIFVNDFPICIECLNELRKNHEIDEKVHNLKLRENTVSELAWDKTFSNGWWHDDGQEVKF